MTWSGIFGNLGTTMGIATQANAAQQSYNPHQSAMYQQQAFNQYAQTMSQRQAMDWVLAGTPMTLMEFADEIWPEPCAEKTHFILKYSK
jgi:hypothetical protein